jgi:hypothetical protein
MLAVLLLGTALCCLAQNPRTLADTDTATIKASADAGDPAAEDELARRYEYGIGDVPNNHAQAMSLWLKSAQQGRAHAQWALATRLLKTDRPAAATWYERAALQGDRDSEEALGHMYGDGSGGFPLDGKRAIYWYEKAVAQGDKNTEINLGHMYMEGKAVPKNLDLAIYWYQKAVDDGSQFAAQVVPVVAELKAEKAASVTGHAVQESRPQSVGQQPAVPPPPPPPASGSVGPTMEQTIDFISGLLTKQGAISNINMQQIKLQAPCSAEILNHRGHTNRYFLDLSKSDPKSLSVIHYDESSLYGLSLSRASYRLVPLDNPAPASGPATHDVSGLVHDISADQIVVASDDDNHLYVFGLSKKTVMTTPTENYKLVDISPSEIKVGDRVSVIPSGIKKGVAQAENMVVFPVVYTTDPRVFDALVFNDPDVAQRAAKALIHAIVLCHKPEGPSLF